MASVRAPPVHVRRRADRLVAEELAHAVGQAPRLQEPRGDRVAATVRRPPLREAGVGGEAGRHVLGVEGVRQVAEGSAHVPGIEEAGVGVPAS